MECAAARALLLKEFVEGLLLGLVYFFRPKSALNYPWTLHTANCTAQTVHGTGKAITRSFSSSSEGKEGRHVPLEKRFVC